MRRLTDDEGRSWDVVLGRESWGALLALFVPAGSERNDPIRQALLDADGYDAAQQELDDMDESRLRELLARSEPKP